MFSLRPRSFFDYGFPNYRSAPSPFFGDLLDDFFEPAPTFEFVPVVYRPVNRSTQPNQKPRSEKKKSQERVEQQQKKEEVAPATEAKPERKVPATGSADPQQVAERPAPSPVSTLPVTFSKPLDMRVKDEDARLVVTADLHGVPQDKIDLSIENGLLRLAATRLHEHKDEHSAMRYQEMLQRAVALPSGVDESQITATYNEGVLEVIVPKPESARRKRVTISSKSAAAAPASLEETKKTAEPAEKPKCA